MWLPETDRRSTTGHAETGRPRAHALVVHGAAADRPSVRALGRPMAGFLAQLIVSADPTLAPSRSDRTRVAAARYTQARNGFSD